MVRVVGVAGMTVAVSLVLAGCGGNDAPDDAAAADAAEHADEKEAAASNDPGQEGTLTLDGQTWSFRVTHCSRGSEESGRLRFYLTGEGEGDLEVFADRHAGLPPGGPAGGEEGAGYGETIELRVGEVWDAEVHWKAMSLPSEPSFLEIDGKSVSATTTFRDEVTETESGRPRTAEGTFEATCP